MGSNYWHLQFVDEKSPAESCIEGIFGRLDHDGVESEEGDRFVIAAQEVLLQAIDRREEFLGDFEGTDDEQKKQYGALINGLQQMIALSEGEAVVFWTNGTAADQAQLIEAIRRFRLGKAHPDYFWPRHRQWRESERIFQINWQRKELRQRLMTSDPDKSLKRFIHNLADRPRMVWRNNQID